MDRAFELSMILANNGIGPLIDEVKVRENSFFSNFFSIGADMCEQFTDGVVEFRLVENSSINAIAVHPTMTVLVCRGALNAVLRIAAAIVGKGVFPNIGCQDKPTFNADSLQYILSKKSIIDAKSDFTLDAVAQPWAADVERFAMFNFISETLFRFIVCHEIGHMFHEHGNRNGREADSAVDTDEMTYRARVGSLDHQARESIADTHGFQLLTDYLQWHFQNPFPNRELRVIKSKFVRDDRELVLRCLQIVFVYFYMMEAADWQEEDPMKWSHPPTAFRLQTIFAPLLEHGILDVSKEDLPRVIQEVIETSEAAVALAFDLIPDALHWLLEMGDKKYEQHYMKLLEKIPKWCIEGEKKWTLP